MSMSFTGEFLNTLASYKGLTDLFVLKNDGENLRISGYQTKDKISIKYMAFIVEAPKRHFDAGDDVGFMEFGRFFRMLNLATKNDLEKADIKALKTSEGVAGFSIHSPLMETAMEYRLASLDSIELKQNLWTGLKKDGKTYTSIPDSLIKSRFHLSKNDIDNLFDYGDVIAADTVTLDAKNDKITFSYINSATNNKTKFSIDAEVVAEASASFALDLMKKLPKEEFNVCMAGNVMTWDQVMPPVGEGDKAVPSDIVVRTAIFALSHKN